MKLWIDDMRSAPEGYVWCKSVNDAIIYIERNERQQKNILKIALHHLQTYNMALYLGGLKLINNRSIDLIDIDLNAGEYASDGGDYIKLLDWLEETGRNYPIRIHSTKPVGVENMRRIIVRNGRKEVK